MKSNLKLLPILGLFILVVYLISLDPFSRTPKLAVEEIKKATPSAQPSPTPEPSPTHSGRQIRVPILLYHYIGENPDPKDVARDSLSVAPSVFDEQMNYLQKNGYTPITLDTMMAGLYGQVSLPPKPVVITFDDGYIDLYLNAFPILQKYQFRAVAFIPTGLIGTSYYANWDQLLEMQNSGLLSFQAHGVTHTNLASLSADQLNHELSESKKVLESRFGLPVNFIAYPYGIYNQKVLTSAKEAGYVGGVGTWPSNIVSEGVLYNMPRMRVGGQSSLSNFSSKL